MAVQRGLGVHVLDRITEGLKCDLVETLGARYHLTPVADLRLEVDVVLECTGAASAVLEVLGGTAHNGIVCLAGVSSPGRRIAVDIGRLNRELVLDRTSSSARSMPTAAITNRAPKRSLRPMRRGCRGC